MQDLAAVHVVTGRIDDLITELESLLAVPGMFPAQHLRADPLRARSLEAHPRFPARA